MKSGKIKFIVLVLILTIITIAIATAYALVVWNSTNNTELTVRIGDIAGVYFDNGPNINVSNLGPVFDYEQDGESTYFTVANYTNTELTINAMLNITLISDNLKEESFKYVVMSTSDNANYTKVNEGNFSTVSNGSSIPLVVDSVLTSNGTITYKVIIFIDGNMENPITMQGGSLDGVIAVDAREPADIEIVNMTVDGNSTTVFPVGSYTVDTNCTGATTTYDYETERFKISNVSVNSKANCSPIVTSKTTTYLNNYIISLSGTTQGTGQVVNENGYRYEGKNPNNYVKFNNELWRVIGVFDKTSHGITDTYLTKIIREDSLGGYDHKNYVWPNSYIYKLLNTYYYNATDGTNSGYCLQTDNPDKTGNCNYIVKGIQNKYRSMVKNVTWYLGGYYQSLIEVTTKDIYGYERSSYDYYYADPNYKTTSGYIGLMYVSDYGYSVLSSSCARTIYFNSYGRESCAGNSWLKKETYEWTIGGVSNYNEEGEETVGSGFFFIYPVGGLNPGGGSMSVRPVLYLDSSVFIVSGTGSLIDPYIINI